MSETEEKKKEIKKKDILMLLPLTALSLADPITDILTLMEFYSADHKSWFAVGLIIFILPCFAFYPIFWGTGRRSTKRTLFGIACLGGFHPFSTAIQRLEALIICSREKLWHGNNIEEGSHEFEVLEASQDSGLFEAVYEAAPQFVIQLYVMNVQQEPMSIIQMISLPVSFASLVWSLKPAEEDVKINIPIKYKILNFVTHLLLLSARLFAITYFVVAYKWLIIGVLIIHINILRIMRAIWPYTDYRCGCCCCCCGVFSCLCDFESYRELFDWYLIIGLSWIGYDAFDTNGNVKKTGVKVSRETGMKHLKIITVCSHISLMLQNFAMIWLYYLYKDFQKFYFNDVRELHFWYSLPLTVCVCSFSFFGVVIRSVAHLVNHAPMGQARSIIHRAGKGLDRKFCDTSGCNAG
ncbi:uncharacterized protein LOC122947903 [Acropora millepora]|uniref:uncharacterized protein LOC122947903 n=1 Tax=Acropora millepora TaxID=45264 RepID=UPI001CF2C11D|nr:uncharacterized protein LOC122947903 [Acropora millepora]